MNTWRVAVVLSVVLAVAVIVGAELFSDAPWRWHPFDLPRALRFHGRLGRLAEAGVAKRIALRFAALITHYLIGVLVLFLIPRRVRLLAQVATAGGKPLAWSWLVGLLGTILVGSLAALAALGALTFPVGLLLAGLYFLAGWVGLVALTYCFGRGLLRRARWGSNPLVGLALGTLILFALFRLPMVGLGFFGLVWLAAVGMALITRLGSGRRWTLEPLLEQA
jgi:hypothetical protein